jgi:hypothetical protein
MPGATYAANNGRCNRCTNHAKNIMKQFKSGELTVNETIIEYPYTILAQRINKRVLDDIMHGEILSIDQDIIDSMCV